MVGYRRKPKLVTLKWAEDHELHGLEVTTKGLTVEHMLGIVKLMSALGSAKDVSSQSQAANSLFTAFAKSLHSWNLEDDQGKPVPASYDGIAGEDLDFVMSLVTTWIDAISGVDTPLPEGSNSGEIALAASLPMEPLSASPQS